MRTMSIALAALALAAGPAAARPLDNQPPGTQAAIAACKAKGVQGGTPAFNQCVQQQLNGGATLSASAQNCQAQGLTVGSDAFNNCVKAADAAAAAAQKGQPLTDKQKAATAACTAQGYAVNTSAYQDCIKDQLSVSGASTDAEKAAEAGCAASGLKPLTAAYKTCVNAAAQAQAVAGFTGEQMAAYNACKSQGIALGSNAFAQCLSKLLSKVIPDNGKAATGELDKVVAACNASHPKTATALQACVKSGLGS